MGIVKSNRKFGKKCSQLMLPHLMWVIAATLGMLGADVTCHLHQTVMYLQPGNSRRWTWVEMTLYCKISALKYSRL